LWVNGINEMVASFPSTSKHSAKPEPFLRSLPATIVCH